MSDRGPEVRRWILAALVLGLAGCQSGGGYYQDDGPPRRDTVDIESIPEPVPRKEPLSKTGNSPYVALGERYVPMPSADGYRKRGTASWYGKQFHGRRTSSGERYDMYKVTAAHRTLPLPSYARVTNLRNGRSIIVRVNDRGPFLHDRLIDLSYAAAHKLGIIKRGTGRVEVRAITPQAVPATATGGTARRDTPPPGSDDERYYVQFGAFSESTNAQSLKRKLQRNGIGFAQVQHTDDGYFKVRSGPFSASSTAERVLMRGAALGLQTTIVMEQAQP